MHSQKGDCEHAGHGAESDRIRSSEPGPDADALAGALKRFRDSWFSGEKPDPDDFCEGHPECGPRLREEIDDFLFVAENLPQPGEPEIDSAPDSAEPRREEIDLSPRPAEKNSDLPTGKILGDFRVVREIGSGGMGTVYEAEQISLKRRVALKVLPPHLSFSDRAVGKFHREAEAGGRQSHPGIVAVFAVGEHEGVHFIAQELVDKGTTLADKLDEIDTDGEQPSGYFVDVAGLFADIADALEHAHRSGVVHRDVKPSNILLTSDGRPKITDFGLAKIEDALALSRSGEFSGTPYYMSPEQATSKRIGIDHRTDIFSLGVTLYETLTLKRPFEGETREAVLKKILFTDPCDPHKADQRVPRELSVICIKAMEKEVENRFQTMGEFSADLKRFATGRKIVTCGAGVVTRAFRRIRRHPVASASIAAAIATVTLLALLLSGAGLEEAARTNSDEASLGITLYRRDGDSSLEDVGMRLYPARYNDDIRLRVGLGEGSFCYLIAFNPDGKDQLCYPQSPSERPRELDKLDYPEDAELAFGLTDGVGLQAFVLLVSHEPLPPYEEWKISAAAPQWSREMAAEKWLFDGREYLAPNRTRGTLRPLGSRPPDAFRELCAFYRNRPEFDAVRAIAFPVIEREAINISPDGE